MVKGEQVIGGYYLDLTPFRSGHVSSVEGGFTTPLPWDIIDKNES